MSFHFNGFGTGFVGRNQPGADGTYVITERVMLMFVPIYPIKSIRVLSEGDVKGVLFFYMSREHRYVRVPLDVAHVRRIYTGVGLLVMTICLLIWWSLSQPR